MRNQIQFGYKKTGLLEQERENTFEMIAYD